MPKRKDARSPEADGTRIETMRERDLDQVLEIERGVFPVPWSRESFRRELGNPRARNLVVRRGSEIEARSKAEALLTRVREIMPASWTPSLDAKVDAHLAEQVRKP